MQRRRIGRVVVLGSITLTVAMAGCGGPSSVAKKPAASPAVPEKPSPAARPASPPASAPATGAANPGKPAAQAANESPAAKPVVEAASKPSAPPKPVEPTDARDVAAVLDLRKLPAPDGTTIDAASATKLQAVVPLPVIPAVDFYLGKLAKLGWTPAGPRTAESVTESFAQVSIGKDGYLLRLTALPGEPKQSGVTIEHLGNLDSRTLPRIEGSEDQYSAQSNSLYFARGKVDEATATLRRLMKSQGWQEYDEDAGQSASRGDASDLLFRKKGYSVRMYIDRPATQPDKIAVQYTVTTLEHDLPAPEDANKLQIQDSQWILTCEVPRDMAGTAEFYRKTMQGIGFPSPPHETAAGKSMTLSFESDDHDLVLVSLKAAGDHLTHVKLEGHSAAFREAVKKAAIAAQAKREAEGAKAFQDAFQRQQEMIHGAIGGALKEGTPPSKQTDLSKKIQADVDAQVEKALKGAGANDPGHPAK